MNAGYAHLAVIYLAWGSTFLAIRVGARPGSGFPPLWLAACRVLTAGTLTLAWAALRGYRIRPSARALAALLATGCLFWVGGHSLVIWGESRADSGYAALLFGSMPLWGLVLETLGRKRTPPSARSAAPVLVGFAGVLCLSLPALLQALRAAPSAEAGADPKALLALLLAPVSWAAATVFQPAELLSLPAPVVAGWQQLLGGLACASLALGLGEPLPRPIPEALAAWLYLTTVGSLLAFTCFTQATRLLPSRVVMSFAYVNPVIAVLLGRVILGERLTPWTLAGMALIIAGVGGLLLSQGPKRGASEPSPRPLTPA